jgi:hypothetical protein
MASLDRQIDELYQRPLGEFVSARNALAKTLDRDAAARVKRLEKPTVVPWAANQVYWRSRPVWDRLIAAGAALRRAQVAVLEGRNADLRKAAEDHRQAIAAAVREAEALAAASGAHPAADALMRTFEALSLATEPPAHPGRLTEPLQPAGFEALAGVTPIAAARPAHVKNRPVARHDTGVDGASRAAERRAAAEAAAATREAERLEREAQARIAAAERTLERARAAEASARERLDAARRDREQAERELEAARVRR